ADRDDAAAFLHERSGRSHGSGDTADIDGEEAIELSEVVSAVMDLAHGKHAGIVDENIQAAEAFDNGFHKLLHFLGVGLVGLEGVGAYALRQKLVNHRLGLVGRGRIADGDVGPIVSEGPRDRSAYAARAAGYEGNFS